MRRTDVPVATFCGSMAYTRLWFLAAIVDLGKDINIGDGMLQDVEEPIIELLQATMHVDMKTLVNALLMRCMQAIAVHKPVCEAVIELSVMLQQKFQA